MLKAEALVRLGLLNKVIISRAIIIIIRRGYLYQSCLESRSLGLG
jgi:hypothetical protein